MSIYLALTAAVIWVLAAVLSLSATRMVSRRGETQWRYAERQASRYSWAWGWFGSGLFLMLAAIWWGSFR